MIAFIDEGNRNNYDNIAVTESWLKTDRKYLALISNRYI